MHRPIVMEVRQEDFRFYFDKWIYAFRRTDGVLVRVTDFTGGSVIAEKRSRAVTISKEHPAHNGPVKWSDFWNRPAFRVTAKASDGDIVRNLYLRDYYSMRTDNMIFWPEEGRENIDVFVGASPVWEAMGTD